MAALLKNCQTPCPPDHTPGTDRCTGMPSDYNAIRLQNCVLLRATRTKPRANCLSSARYCKKKSSSPDGKFSPMDPVSKANSTGSKLQLYSYYQSSCAWRVRIALSLKGLDYEYKAVNLLKGEQFSPEFSKLNPLNYVPVLVDEGKVIADSLAVILYLEEKYPQHPLLPQDLHKKAINFQAANIVAANIQPFQNRSVLIYIEGKVNADEKIVWAQYHIAKGLAALEKLLKDYAGKYATGDEVFLADLFLAPQIHAAINRFKVDMAEFPTLVRLNEAYEQQPAFRAAMPDMQPDAVKR